MSNKKQSRFATIDGFRGLAALGVVLYHFYGSLKPALDNALPSFITTIFSYGYLGVPIFFVISGFVISHTVGNTKITRKYFGNFILRRSIRLDFTYWASIFLAIILLLGKNLYQNGDEPIPSMGNILIHMFYLQDITQTLPLISVVYWTLCLEVQFYLFYILTLWLAQKFASITNATHYLIVLVVGCYSILLDYGLLAAPYPGLFFSNWHYFLLGLLISKSYSSTNNTPVFIWLATELVFMIFQDVRPYIYAGLIFSIMLFLILKFRLQNKLLNAKAFQYFGAISYTLYLVHPDIGWKAIAICKNFFHEDLSPLNALTLLSVGLVVSIVTAHTLHKLVERPSLKLAGELKHRRLMDILLRRHTARLKIQE